MPNIRPIFPGAFTMGNLLFGFLAVLSAFDGEALQAAWFVLVAAFLDGLDGTVARISKATSTIGIELDSLAKDGPARGRPGLCGSLPLGSFYKFQPARY